MQRESNLLFVNDDNWMSAIPLRVLEEQWWNKKQVSIKGDQKLQMFMFKGDSQILIFTNLGRVYMMNGNDFTKNYSSSLQSNYCSIELTSWCKFSFPKIVEESNGVNSKERIVSVLSDHDLIDSDQFQLFLITEKGKCKKLETKHLRNVSKSGKIIIQLKDGDQLKQVQKIDSQSEIVLISSEGKAVRFSSSDVRSMGRNSMGVKGINLGSRELEGVEGKLSFLTTNLEGNRLLIIGDKGYGKIFKLPQISLVKRGNKKGMTCHNLKTSGWIIFASCVNWDDHLIGLTYRNNLHKLQVDKLPVLDNRYSRGAHILGEKQRFYDSLVEVIKYTN
ncbi:hypothetical protein OVS_03780 [Mycoplasma ovis str. Michigan]|uniref:DNA gyrase subunit A n=2 Tax=Mycoplasma ovis TaxID=171632 RepID=A0ABN4BM92_9MOLU|nr:hypothetical protein OVS_03780 [Mycoplasma ovis str. Michigan]